MRIIAAITVTRPDRIERVRANLADCDELIFLEDTEREGMAKTRNKILDLLKPGDIVRFVDDDDIAFNSRLIASNFIDCDILTFSYVVNSVCIPVPTDPIIAAMSSISSWNWFISAEAAWRMRDRFNELFVTQYSHNIGVWTWLRIIDEELKIKSVPNLYGYSWNRLSEKGSMTSSNSEVGRELRLNLKGWALSTNSSEALAQLAGRLGAFGQSVGVNKYALG